jgi:acetyl-CoA carboxylase carboxyl transferase subunit beta
VWAQGLATAGDTFDLTAHMAWFRKEQKPRQPRRERLEIPPDTWEKCEACGHTDIRDKFLRNFNVCPQCDYHRRLRAWDYATMLFDDGTIGEIGGELRSVDPLGFPEYPARLKRALANAGDSDAILTVTGLIEALPVGIGIMDFAFMGGSMGSVVGEKIARLGQRSLEKKHPLVIISASGGARMQEGVLSLMQMAKASAVLSQLAERRIPYLSILTNPTTGGVSASFAMLGDAILAEPGAVIGFAGPRVIKQTLGQDLPEGFQTAEFLVDHGMVDSVVHRKELRATISRLLRHMTGRPAAAGHAQEG